jgi:hypothetical protein
MSSVRESGFGAERFEGGGEGERRELLRSLNDRLADSARRHHFETARIPFHCECGAATCEELALYRLGAYVELRGTRSSLLAPRHT